MANFKEGCRRNLKFQTSAGLLNMITIWQTSDEDLVNLENQLKDEVKASKKSTNRFSKAKKDNKELKLKLSIISEIIDTIIEEREEYSSANTRKQHNNKIDELILQKKEKELENLSIEELEKLKK